MAIELSLGAPAQVLPDVQAPLATWGHHHEQPLDEPTSLLAIHPTVGNDL
jgi:hypothetical protein